MASSFGGSVARRRRSMVCTGAVLAMLVCPGGARAACSADSGTTRATLVELYTSEGCSSCPPADRELRALTMAGPRVVPLALHVDYWDGIGWKDRFAQPGFTERQQWEVRANRHRTSFTPHFFVDGREVLDWRDDLSGALRPTAAATAARIVVRAVARGTTLHLQVEGSSTPDGRRGPQVMFVAVTENGLASQVDAGENRGARLEHDAVARQWIGPIAVRDGKASVERDVAVPTLAGGHVGVVAFIQDATTAEVLQAVGTGTCSPT